MAQPSVAAYFNTRKRVAVDEAKINRARKVLIVDEGEDKISRKVTYLDSHESKVENVASDKSCKEVDKLVPNKIILKAESTVSMAKKSTKPRSSAARRKVAVGIKGQQNLQKFMTKPITDETEKCTSYPDGQQEEPKEKHFTPPASPVKSQNAMDRVLEKPKDVSLNALKLKLSRSTRLAELKASLSKFNESHSKLKEIEKVTSKISVNTEQSPKLKSFKSIELEVNLSPQKVQSPEKLYLSPKKDVSARKNLFNLLSPAKSTLTFSAESPSKKIQELNSKPALTLPFKYRYFAEMFRAIDTVCQLLYNRKETITLPKLKSGVEKMIKRNMANKCLAQIKHIYPEAFKFHQEKLRVFGSGKREEKWALVVSPVVESERITSEVLLTRKRVLFDLLLEKVKDYHHEFLMGLEPPMVIPKTKITRWHPEFDIEKVPDIEEDQLPEPPEDQKLISGQEVLQKARQMFSCNTRIEQALKKLNGKKEEESVEKPQVSTAPSSILKGIPKALLEKVRQKQAAKAMILMTRTAEKDKELQIYSRLPELARLMLYMFVTEKKSSLPLTYVMQKLENCYRITLTKSEMKDHIELIAKELPDWLVLHKNIDKVPFVKLDRRADLSVITSKLESLIKVKSNS